MRCLLTMEIDTEAGNLAISNGEIGKILQEMLEMLKPEATYFTTINGNRTGFIVFDLTDPSQIPVIAEPLFQRLKAKVSLNPVMNLEDLQKGVGQLGG